MTRLSPLAVTALVLVLVSGAAAAHRDATGIVKQRMDAMTAMGDAMKSLRNDTATLSFPVDRELRPARRRTPH